MMKKRLSVIAVILLVAVCAVGQQKSAPAAPPAGASAQAANPGNPDNVPRGFAQRYPRYQIRPSDAFDLNFEFTPELNQSVVVQPDGFVTLREIGDVQVAGLTVPQLTDRLKLAYGKILHDPVITVFLKDFDKPYFICNGQVARPGKYDLRADTTLTEGIAIAGGLLESAKHSQVVLFRRASNAMYEAKLIDVKKMMAARDLREDEHLQPGDMIWVPQNRISKIKKFLPLPAVTAAMNPAQF